MNLLALLIVFIALSIAERSVAEETVDPKRVAIVIGNDAYEHAPELGNPINDSTAFGGKLEAAGYSVTVVQDASIRDLHKALRAFCREADDAEAALFFFAGHGIEADGENYLIPVDAELEEEFDLDIETLNLKKVIQDVGDTRAQLKIMILDCCRNNPFSGTRAWVKKTRSAGSGLAKVDKNELRAGTMLVFSAAPGKPALDGTDGHSPFTAALLSEMKSPGDSIGAVFGRVAQAVSKQEPWIEFDGSGKSYAAFNTYPLLPRNSGQYKPEEHGSDMAQMQKYGELLKQTAELLRQQGEENEALKAQMLSLETGLKNNPSQQSGDRSDDLERMKAEMEAEIEKRITSALSERDSVIEKSKESPEAFVGAEIKKKDDEIKSLKEKIMMIESESSQSEEPQRSFLPERWDHNGSLMTLTQNENEITIYYSVPRGGLPSYVGSGTVLFTGTISDENVVEGKARRFKSGLKPIEYDVRGAISNDSYISLITNRAPSRNSSGTIYKYSYENLKFNKK